MVRTRLRRAAVALAATDEPIAEIAFAHGFGDLSTFVTTFGRVFGKPPRAYRRAARARGAVRQRVGIVNLNPGEGAVDCDGESYSRSE